MQSELSQANKAAWETKAYEAWTRHYGAPEALAEELKRGHRQRLRYWLKYIGDPAGKRVLNLLGSTGRKAIALALLGADATVVDISEANRQYALEVAAAAGVGLDYICADALSIPDEAALGDFDIVLMEFGVLHYFTDLDALFALVQRRLRPQGRLLLTDFHPFARTWLATGNLPQPGGDYFDTGIREGEVAYAKLLPEEERSDLQPVRTKSWTVGDILTAVAGAGLGLRAFEELPGPADPRFPQFYTLVADRLGLDLPPLYPEGRGIGNAGGMKSDSSSHR